MSKGDKLGELISAGEDIHRQMNQLFLKDGMTTPDLSRLSEVDRIEWYRLKVLSDEKLKEISNLIIN